eukprot:TRINITY_DN33638_c0_g1_i1.p1 TRINITY_DN33638_c0_g1~~TRINITY_DN33638_c0_g1_i1.p1  ORF type:complete len:364 (+),score=52.08 TRINITY_DN33638_c0_g1_i1:93-1184(+)
MANEQSLVSSFDQALPTLLNATSRRPLTGVNRSGVPKPKMEIAIPVPCIQHAYPSEAVHVRNTFIHVASPMADNATNGRMAFSCPSSHIGRIRESFKADDGISDEVSASVPKQVLVLEHALSDHIPDTPEARSMGCMGLSPWHGSQGTPEKLGQHDLHGLFSYQPAFLPSASGCGSSMDWCPYTAGDALLRNSDHHIPCSIPGSLPGLCTTQAGSQMIGISAETGIPTQGNPPYAPSHAAASLFSPPPGFESYSPMRDPPFAQKLAEQLVTGATTNLFTMKQSLEEIPMCPPSMHRPSEPAPGSAELPSIGSREHRVGECKPCAFLHTKGCNSGAMCSFCHLCVAGEKKRRQRAKKAMMKDGC